MRRWLILLLLILLLLASAASLLAGPIWLTPAQLMAGLGNVDHDLAGLLLFEIRLPRLILAILVGGVLGLSGAVLQGLLRNPLAEPGLLGVSGGASFGAVIAIYFGFSAGFSLATPIFALTGGLVTAALALQLARGGGTLSLILAGAALTAITFALTNLALNLAPSPFAAYEIMTWLQGSLADRSWDHVKVAAPFIAAGAVLLFLTARSLDALSLGEAQAASLGVDLQRVRLLALFGTALGVGGATAVAGAITFVGLVAPHLVRPLVGHRPSAVLAPAALAGAILLVVADVLARIIPAQPQLKLGVLISVVGAPFFLWLVLHVRRRTA